ncbi:MAG: TM2 domain-containing protein [Bacteroidaceae bacterium]
MDQQRVDMFLMSNASKFPEGHMLFLRNHLTSLDDSKAFILTTLQLKDPTTALVISLLVGGFGADRFYLGQTGYGILKLITCGGLGVWTIVDWFLILGATKDYNLEKLRRFLP